GERGGHRRFHRTTSGPPAVTGTAERSLVIRLAWGDCHRQGAGRAPTPKAWLRFRARSVSAGSDTPLPNGRGSDHHVILILDQMRPQLANGLVLPGGEAFRRWVQLGRDHLHGPALEAHLQDALLTERQQFLGRLPNLFAFLGPLPGGPVARVGHAVDRVRAAPSALGAFLDRVDGPQELASVLAFIFENAVPVLGRHALQQAAEDFLGAIRPAVGRQPGVAPARRAITVHVIDGL